MRKIGQSVTCFVGGLVGLLGTGAQIESHEYLLAVWFGFLTIAAFSLGVWLFRRGKREVDS